MVSVCTGAFALAAAGLLDHRRATTHWQYAGDLGARFPAVKVDPDVLWVDEGAVLTSAGLAAGIDLCVQLVRADYGTDAAIRVARRMVVAPHRDGGQAQWLERPVPLPGHGLAATCEWALERLADPLTVADLARQAGWAPRTFSRQFVAETGLTPLRWLTAARVREARRLLEVSDLPVEDNRPPQRPRQPRQPPRPPGARRGGDPHRLSRRLPRPHGPPMRPARNGRRSHVPRRRSVFRS